MNKDEMIKEAWGDSVANYSEKTGWAVTYVCNGIDDFTKEMQEYFDIEYVEQDIMRYRPKSLQGIENNNVWISLKESGLPNDDSYYFVNIDNHISIKQFHIIQYKWWVRNVTHYQPIKKPKPPVF